MECKVPVGICFPTSFLDLIETSWNVKKKGSDADRDRKTDLIETSWNVKEQYARSGIRMEQDLIETSWNVKVQVQSVAAAV